MKINRLKIDNFMKLNVDIEMFGKSMIIKGKNSIGKSSFIDSIWYLLTGKKIPDEPIQKGKDSGSIEAVIDRGEDAPLICTRKFRRDGEDTLTVRTEGGAAFSSPQTFLNNLIGQISFDPFEFVNKQPLDQKKEIQKILGVDTTEIERKKKLMLTEKGSLENTLMQLQTEFNKLPEVTEHLERRKMDEVTEKQKSIKDIRDKKEAIKEEIQVCKQQSTDITNNQIFILNQRTTNLTKIVALEKQIAELNQQNEEGLQKEADNKKNLQMLAEQLDKFNKSYSDIADPDDTEIQTIIEEINKHNERVAQMDQSLALGVKIEAAMKAIETKKSEMEALENDRVKLIQSAKMPIPGLDFGEDNLIFDGLPFTKKQFSTAAMVVIGTQIIIAMNPALRIMRVKDWALLDTETKEKITDLAAEHDFQIFAELVTDDPTIGFEITEQKITEESPEPAS